MPWYMCQRTTCTSQFSPSMMGTLGIKRDKHLVVERFVSSGIAQTTSCKFLLEKKNLSLHVDVYLEFNIPANIHTDRHTNIQRQMDINTSEDGQQYDSFNKL